MKIFKHIRTEIILQQNTTQFNHFNLGPILFCLDSHLLLPLPAGLVVVRFKKVCVSHITM